MYQALKWLDVLCMDTMMRSPQQVVLLFLSLSVISLTPTLAIVKECPLMTYHVPIHRERFIDLKLFEDSCLVCPGSEQDRKKPDITGVPELISDINATLYWNHHDIILQVPEDSFRTLPKGQESYVYISLYHKCGQIEPFTEQMNPTINIALVPVDEERKLKTGLMIGVPVGIVVLVGIMVTIIVAKRWPRPPKPIGPPPDDQYEGRDASPGPRHRIDEEIGVDDHIDFGPDGQRPPSSIPLSDYDTDTPQSARNTPSRLATATTPLLGSFSGYESTGSKTSKKSIGSKHDDPVSIAPLGNSKSSGV